MNEREREKNDCFRLDWNLFLGKQQAEIMSV